ncbi:replicative DNA helicase loader DnaB [Paenibacillus uliginis N3/975]|uniref:Replicative DNA helicase loader DnaB n=1 Tax=Paenibacillus uliginis N3/975 TaxID=1313296 RepID=A0A1X7GNV4_9BACL|nr:DnaD domain protein [Paenibacillus uliginis]SMF71842.1 replicative DNA helicase loader DnaB [Paenibacillus uliginis N3/975]
MRMTNFLHFTENHRYCVYRDFCLSGLDDKMLSSIYQPMVGAFAVSLYRLMFMHVPLEMVGYSAIEQQRRLFLTLGLEPSEKGRKYLIEQTSKLEAVGLLQTSRMFVPETDDYIYEYELQAPLSPSDFFNTQHLTLLLRDKVGKFSVLSLREQLWSKEPQEWSGISLNKENISVPFYDIFELNTHVIDYELEQALTEVEPPRNPSAQHIVPQGEGLNYSDIILRFPRESKNRVFVERLRYDHEQMGIVNYVVRKYDLSVQDLCRLLDEDEIFSSQGEVMLDELQHRASLHFRQGMKLQEKRQITAGKVVALHQELNADPDVPVEEHAVQMEYYVEVPSQFQSKCDIHQYNMMLRNEPYTKLLQTFFPGSVPAHFMEMFEKIDLSYKLPGEVINVLIHYLMSLIAAGGDQRINRNFVEAIASNMLLKQVNSYEKAVQYIRDQAKMKGKQAAAASRTRTYAKSGKVKPEIPVALESAQGEAVTEEEYEEMLKLAAKMQASKKRGG